MLLVVVVGGSSTPPVPPRAAEFNWRLLVGKIDELPAALVSNGCQGLVSVYTAIECGEEQAVELSSSSSSCCCTAPPGFIHWQCSAAQRVFYHNHHASTNHPTPNLWDPAPLPSRNCLLRIFHKRMLNMREQPPHTHRTPLGVRTLNYIETISAQGMRRSASGWLEGNKERTEWWLRFRRVETGWGGGVGTEVESMY